MRLEPLTDAECQVLADTVPIGLHPAKERLALVRAGYTLAVMRAMQPTGAGKYSDIVSDGGMDPR